jgi:phosphomannomutase
VERYTSSGEINFVVSDPAISVEAVSTAFAEASQDRLDGLTIDLGEGWFNVRPSNTEPLLRLNAEARDRETVDRIVKRVSEIVETAD